MSSYSELLKKAQSYAAKRDKEDEEARKVTQTRIANKERLASLIQQPKATSSVKSTSGGMGTNSKLKVGSASSSGFKAGSVQTSVLNSTKKNTVLGKSNIQLDTSVLNSTKKSTGSTVKQDFSNSFLTGDERINLAKQASGVTQSATQKKMGQGTIQAALDKAEYNATHAAPTDTFSENAASGRQRMQSVSNLNSLLSEKPKSDAVSRAQSMYEQWNQEYKAADLSAQKYNDEALYNDTAAAKEKARKAKETKETVQGEWGSTMQAILDSLGDGAKAQFSRWANTEDKATKSERWTELYNTYGKDLANQLGEYVQQQVNAGNMEEVIASTKDYTDENWLRASLLSVPQNLGGGISGTLNALGQGVERTITGSNAPIDWNTEEQQLGQKARTARETVASGLNEVYDSNVPGFLYQTGMSMLDSAATMPVSIATGGAGTVLLGMSAANSSMQEAKAKGATDSEAISLGLITGAVEVLTEKYSIDSLFKLKDVNSAKDMVGNVIKQAIPEASEEAISEIADTVAETIILGDKSEFKQQMAAYREQGMSENEAFAKAVGNVAVNVGVSALGGALSGAAFATVKGVGGYGLGKVFGADTATDADVPGEQTGSTDLIQRAAQQAEAQPTQSLTERATQQNIPAEEPVWDNLQFGREANTNTTAEQSNLLDTSIQNTLAELGVGQQQQTQPVAQNMDANAESDQQPGSTASAIESDVNPSIGAADKGFTGEIGQWKGEARNFIKESQIPTTDREGNKISASAGSMTETNVPFATKEAVERGAYEGKYSYTPDTNQSQVSRVHQRLESEGFDSLYNQTVAEIQSGKSSADLSAQAYILFIQAANEGRDAQAAELAACIQQNSTNTAQALQAMSIYNKLSPEGRLIAKQKIVNQMNQKQTKKSKGLQEWSDVGELDSVSGETATDTTTDAQTGEKTKRKRKAKVKDSVKTAVEDAIDATANELNSLGSETDARDEGLEKIAKALAKAVDRKVADQDAARNSKDAEGAILERQELSETDSAAEEQAATKRELANIRKDVWRMAKDYLLPKEKGTPRTAVDTLRDFFRNREEYNTVWNKAKEHVRNAHIGEPETAAFEEATMMYNGTGSDPVMTKAIMDDAIVQEIKSSDIQLNKWLGNESALADKLAESLIQQTGATEGNATAIRDACQRYVNEQALNGKEKTTTSRVKKDSRELLKEAGTGISELLKQHPGSREETINGISQMLANVYGVEPENMQKAAGKIADLIDGMIQERAQKNVENVLESEQKKMSNSMKKTLKQTLREAANQGLFSNQDAADIVTRKLFGQPIQIDGDLLQRYLNAKTDEEIDAVETEVYKNIASQLPASFAEKANTWRYMAMLTNPRTHVRNMAGNAAFAGIRKTKNVIGSALESLFTDKNQRTKSIGAGEDLRNVAKADYDNVEQLALNNGKYDDARSQIQENRQIFGSKTLEAIRNWNSNLLDKEDSIFARGAYADSLAGFLKARGISAEDFTSGKCGQAVIDEARAYAIKEAQKATYRDLNSFSEFVQGIGFKNAEGNKYKEAANSVIEGILPFRKTPADILARGVEYSPAGLVTSLTKGTADLKSGKITAAQYIDNISAGLTGTGIFALGFLLSKLGIAVATPDDEDQSDLEGHQNYSIELFGNKYSVTADWLAPTCMPFYMGVQTFDVFNKETGGAPAMEKIQTALRGIADPLLEMSMMSGLQDALEATEYAENDLAAFASNAALGYLKQYIPTVFGSLKRTFEQDVRTTTFTTNSDPVLSKDAQYSIGSVASKIPFANYNQVPYIDAWGRTEDQGNLAERAFNNLLNPAYTSDVVETDVDKEIKRLEKATGENYTPTRGANQLTIKGNAVFLTKDEYVTYATAKGQNDLEFRTNLIGNDSYDLLSDTDKGAAMDYAEKYANIRAEQEVGLDPEVPSWAEGLEDASADEITEAILAKVVSNKAGNAENKYASLSEQLDSGIPEETILQALTESQQEKYEANCKKAKVSAGEYLDVLSFYNSAESDKDKDGKTVSGSKKAKVVKYISGLNLSKKQKRALYLCFYKGDDFE